LIISKGKCLKIDRTQDRKASKTKEGGDKNRKWKELRKLKKEKDKRV